MAKKNDAQMKWRKLNPPPEAAAVLEASGKVVVANSAEDLIQLACGGVPPDDVYEVAYALPGGSRVVEARVCRVRNGISVNYTDPYMRRRDPDCTFLGDDMPTDKPTFKARFGTDFASMRETTLSWLSSQDLAVFAFEAGSEGMGMDAIAICPANAGFFALGLAMLQGILPVDSLKPRFTPKMLIYVAPVFRHTHFDGRQVVVHNRAEKVHEIFSYNLYPGPSAKKGVYGGLLSLGEREGWVTTHCSTVQVITPYDNVVTIMHEGASGGGKSEMLETAHREPDGQLLLGRNIVTDEERFVQLPRSCALRPVTDDMALCHPSLQRGDGKLTLTDAEDAWFIRVNHIQRYATDPIFEALTAQPPEPLLFLNIDAVPNARAMIWEHIEDAPGEHCPNPRVIVPRRIIPNVVEGPVTVDIRSLGVRTPPCTRDRPSYGIIGLFHLLPPALGWLWRLVAPRGHDNPSVVETQGMASEGVGSYWPFATGRRVEHANLLLNQIVASPKVYHILCPNQYLGAWHVGFMPQWIMREYLARRGIARFRPEQIQPARCPLLGHTLHNLTVEGNSVPHWFLQVNSQPEIGEEGYDQGAAILTEFFHAHLKAFIEPDLQPLGRTIIECCLDGGLVRDYQSLLVTPYIADAG